MIFIDSVLDSIFCVIIAYFAFEINRKADINRVGKITVYGIKTIMVTSAAVPLMTLIGLVIPAYLDAANLISGVGINAGLVITLVGHTHMLKARD